MEAAGRRTVLLGAGALLLGGCAGHQAVAKTPAAPTTPVSPSLPNTSPAAAPAGTITVSALDALVAEHLGQASSRLGLAVLDRRTGVLLEHATSNPADGRFEAASTLKVLICAAYCRRRRAQGLAPSAHGRALMGRAIRSSDNDAAQELWLAAGGLWGLQETAEALGMPVTAASVGARTQWGTAFTTPTEQVHLLDVLAAGDGEASPLAPADRARIVALMREVVDGQGWGVGSVASDEVQVALKNGWLQLDDGLWRVNSVGLVQGDGRDLAIAAYQRDLDAESIGIDRLDALAAMLHEALANRLVAG